MLSHYNSQKNAKSLTANKKIPTFLSRDVKLFLVFLTITNDDLLTIRTTIGDGKIIRKILFAVIKIKSYIVAQTLVNRVIPVIQNQGRWSKSEIERKEIIQKMIQQIQNREVPFVQKYNTAIYSQTISKTRYLREYDINSLYLSKLHSQLNASAIKAKSDPREAENYERINKELLQVKSALEKITPLCQMFTYENGFKVLTLSILEYNNLFIEQLTDNSITFGFINSAAKSITNYILRKKLDYAITFAATLGLELSVNIYTTEHNRFILERRLQKLKTPFITCYYDYNCSR